MFNLSVLSALFIKKSISLLMNIMQENVLILGMITSAFFWGIIGDSMGRRTVLLYSYGLDSIVGILASMSQTKWLLMTAKFCSGFV